MVLVLILKYKKIDQSAALSLKNVIIVYKSILNLFFIGEFMSNYLERLEKRVNNFISKGYELESSPHCAGRSFDLETEGVVIGKVGSKYYAYFREEKIPLKSEEIKPIYNKLEKCRALRAEKETERILKEL